MLVVPDEIKLDPQVIASALLDQPQIECPLVHHFADGVYIREMTIPAGTFIVGHFHREGGMNICHKGTGVLFRDGGHSTVTGPEIIHSGPGAKMMHALTDVVWWNIFKNPDNECDISKLEERLVIKDDYFLDLQKEMLRVESDMKIDDVANYSGVAELDGLMARLDSMPVVASECAVEFRESPIEGKGAFSPCARAPGDVIGAYFIEESKTTLAQFANHAKQPNCEIVKSGNSVYMVALCGIHGRLGGMHGEELTINYNSLHNFIEVNK